MSLSGILARGAMALSVAVAVTFAGPVYAANIEVKIDNFVFNPQTITVKAGDTVLWTNVEKAPHTVTSKTGVFRSKTLSAGDKFSFTFATPGTFAYFCALHPHMTASVVVEAEAGK
jgi:plastocyanin